MPPDQAQRTEQPTPRRTQKAREEGQIASSRELTAALQFGAAVLMLSLYGGDVMKALKASLRGLFAEAYRDSMSVERLRGVASSLLLEPLAFLGIFSAVLLGLGILVHLAQTGFALSPKRLQPDLKRLNPFPKLREMPAENLSQTFKALLLLPFIGWVFSYVIGSELPGFLRLPRQSLASGSAHVGEALTGLLLKASALLLLLGLFDFYRQRRKVLKRIMMTKHEVKREQRDLEGNPQIKARLRRLQRDLMRRRMMSQVPKATVVVTNPTHYAVALRYEPETMAAPVVLAKGLDFLAKRIRSLAEEHGIPIVENPPLAQALYKTAEVGSEIPANLYRTVAEILAHIYRLTRRAP